MKKYESLQIVRAFAAWLVVYHHYMQMFYNFESGNFISQFFSDKGGFGVDLFFVLSGFVMFLTSQNNEQSAMSFYTKRVIRIIPAYWFYTFLLMVMLFLLPKVFSFTDYTPQSLLYSLFLIPSQNPTGLGIYPFLTLGWTLIFEMCFYSILAVCILISKNHCVKSCFAIVFIIPLIYPKSFPFSPVLGNFIIWQFLFGFVIGWLINSNFFKATIEFISPTLLAMMLLFMSVIIMSGVTGFGIVHRSIAATMIIVAFILINDKFSYSNPIVKILKKSGDISYSIYLSHIFIIGVILHFTGNKLSWHQDLLNVFTITLVTYGISYLSYRHIENGAAVDSIRKKLVKFDYRHK